MSAGEPVLPHLRFPEFRDAGGWRFEPLRDVASPINERVGSLTSPVPMSITTGVGLVSQEEKFGRTIAGDSYKSYIRLQPDDFAYNKSATNDYPQGYIARYFGTLEAGVPNSIFTCFRPNATEVVPAFLDQLFHANHHGRWLRRYITVGARAHGALSVDNDDLMSMPIPLPPAPVSRAEQQKIADCLDSLDDLMAVDGRALELLGQHKRGLMQHLFPRQGEAQPRERFPQFRDASPWRAGRLGKLFETATGGTPDRSRAEFWDTSIPWVTTSLVDFNIIESTSQSISAAGLASSSAKVFPRQTVLLAMYGQGKTRGKVAMLGIEAATNQACAAILPRDGIDPRFVFLSLGGRYDEIRALSNSGGQMNLSQALVRDIPFSYPDDPTEQEAIIDCLFALDRQIVKRAEKLEALRQHKRGLVQQLIPSSDGRSSVDG